MSATDKYLALLDDMKGLHKRKTADYGGLDDPRCNLRMASEVGIPPWKGCWLRALDKVGRLNHFARTAALANEGVRDSFMDLAAYVLLALVLYEEECEEEKE